MTPNSLEWIKVKRDNWLYYQVGQDEFSYSWESPGIQEIMRNIKETGQSAKLVIFKSGKIYIFSA